MLQELYICNFVLIDEVRLPFHPGLNVLTGETGAGKSILMDALSLVAGARGSADFVRTGEEKATIEAYFTFQTEQPDIVALCQDLGIEYDGDLLVVREMMANGKTVCRVNGRIVTRQMLRQLGEHLLAIHGQHEQHHLLQPHRYLNMIDRYGDEQIAEMADRYRELYQAYCAALQQWREAQTGERDRAQRTDLLQFQLEEIRQAKLVPGEDESLEIERKRLLHAERLFQAAAGAYRMLYEGSDRQPAAMDLIHAAIRDMGTVISLDPALAPVAELLETAAAQLEEAAWQLRDYKESVTFDPERLAQLDERLHILGKLRKKYGESVEAILAYQKKIEEELDGLLHHEENTERLSKKLQAIRLELVHAARALSRARTEVAADIAARTVAQLDDLAMPKVQLDIRIEQDPDPEGLDIGNQAVRFNENGIDRVEFMVSLNPGEPKRPLAKVASGGELSRIMLALKTILADAEGIETLVFDEIDTGIGGRTAHSVAQKLKKIGKGRQVLCVTHLPQVASMADAHVLVTKQEVGGQTRTHLALLNDEQRVDELARMLSGAKTTETTFQHAREMLRFGNQR
jgi:DNA repair protein RecN (Recombination protein N)